MDKKKELEALKKEQRKLIRLRTVAGNKIKESRKYRQLEKVVKQLTRELGRLEKERSKLRKKARKRFIYGEVDYPFWARDASDLYKGRTNIYSKILREIEKVAPLSKLKTLQIEEVVNRLIMREEQNIPKLAKVIDKIVNINERRESTWDKQDKLRDKADIFSDKIAELHKKIKPLEEEIKYPGRVKERKERETAKSLVFNNIDKIYEALTKKKRG